MFFTGNRNGKISMTIHKDTVSTDTIIINNKFYEVFEYDENHNLLLSRLYQTDESNKLICVKIYNMDHSVYEEWFDDDNEVSFIIVDSEFNKRLACEEDFNKKPTDDENITESTNIIADMIDSMYNAFKSLILTPILLILKLFKRRNGKYGRSK